ncbi:MAG TPA: hypothetical protein VIC08_13735 [Cellvibrionaceae bacterium]
MTGYLQSEKKSLEPGEKSAIRNLIETYCQLLKFTICPTRFLRILLTISLSALLMTPALLLLGSPTWIVGVYIVAALIFVMPLFTLQLQMALLTSRKTLALCGNAGVHVGVMAAALLVLVAFIVAPAMVNPLEDVSGYFRAVILWSSILLLLMGVGATWGINLFYVVFFLVVFMGLDSVSETFNYWVVYNSPSLYLLLVAGALAWILFCGRARRGCVKSPVNIFDVSRFKNDKEWMAQWSLFKLMPALNIENNATQNISVLILESRNCLRDYLTMYTIVMLPLSGVLYLLIAYAGFFEDDSYGFLYAIFFMLVPFTITLGGANNYAAVLRRLWLLVPGNRSAHLAILEKQCLKLFLWWLLTGLLPAGVLLLATNQPVLWALLLCVLNATYILGFLYFSLMTMATEEQWNLWARLVFTFALLGLLIVNWTLRDSLMVSVTIILMVLIIVVARQRLFYHWQRVDMSRLKFMQMNPWAQL